MNGDCCPSGVEESSMINKKPAMFYLDKRCYSDAAENQI